LKVTKTGLALKYELVDEMVFLTAVLITDDNLILAERVGEVEGLEIPTATEEAGS
jgi:hypothetical protein